MKVPEASVAAIRIKEPVTKRDLRAFLGTVGHYRTFIPDFGSRAVPLYQALTKVAGSRP